MKTKVYISGPISSLPIEQARANFNKAEEILKSQGYEPINPMKNGLNEADPWIKHITRDLELLHAADAVYFTPGWEDSKGANIECVFAVQTGKAIVRPRTNN